MADQRDSKSPPGRRVWFLRRLNLLEEMPSAAPFLWGGLQEHRFHRRERIAIEAAEACIVRSGRVRIRWPSRRGRHVGSTVLVPGQLFGFGDTLGIGEQAVVEAALAAVLACGTMDAFLAAVDAPARAAEVLPLVLLRHLYRVEQRFELAHARRVPFRVAGILYELAEGNRRKTGVPLITTTHSDIAGMAGTTRESVSRVIAFLREEGVLVGRSVLRVNDPQRLRALAEESGTDRPG